MLHDSDSASEQQRWPRNTYGNIDGGMHQEMYREISWLCRGGLRSLWQKGLLPSY